MGNQSFCQTKTRAEQHKTIEIMGLMRFASNNKLPMTQIKKCRRKRQRRAEIKKKHGYQVGSIDDLELITEHHLKKRRTSARANINLSGKKKRKLMKQLKHMQKEKNDMQVDAEVSSKKKQKIKVTNSEMKEQAVVSEEDVKGNEHPGDPHAAEDAEDAEAGMSEDEVMED